MKSVPRSGALAIAREETPLPSVRSQPTFTLRAVYPESHFAFNFVSQPLAAMRLRFKLALLALPLTTAYPASTAGQPVTPPIELAGARKLFDSWKAPVPPRHLVANIYYVGAIGVSSYLITTPVGHILIDTGFSDTAPIIERGVVELGFKLEDIKYILSSHAHVDHVGGHAQLQRVTGAQVVASAADAAVMSAGGHGDFIPFPRELIFYEPVKVDRIVADGEHITLGPVTLTAHLTPGHTRGATTWTMEIADVTRPVHVVFFSSASINAGTRLTGPNAAYPEIATDLERTFQKLKALPCDIFFAPHGGQFAMAEKFARLDRGENPITALQDAGGWKSLIAKMESDFHATLAAEKSEAAP